MQQLVFSEAYRMLCCMFSMVAILNSVLASHPRQSSMSHPFLVCFTNRLGW